MGSKWVHISQLRSAGARIFNENERRDWNKTYHKAFGNGGGRLGNSNKKAPSLLFPNSLATRNQFDFALPLGPDVSFHMRVKRFKVSYIWSGLGFISADIDPTNHINISSSLAGTAAFGYFSSRKSQAARNSRAHFFTVFSPPSGWLQQSIFQPKWQPRG